MNAKEGHVKSIKNALYVQRMAKDTSWAKAMSEGRWAGRQVDGKPTN